jgi:hypothetical protein
VSAKRKPAIRVEWEVGWIDSDGVARLPIGPLKAYIRMADWCRLRGTDGFVSEEAAVRCCTASTHARRQLRALLDAGLVNEVEGGFDVPAYLKHNRPHSAIADRSQRRSERSRKHRRKSDATGEQGAVGSLSPTEREGASASAPDGEVRRWRHGRRVVRKPDGKIEIEMIPGQWVPVVQWDSSLTSEGVWKDAMESGD